MIKYEDQNYLRITKNQARKLYDAGESVYLCPCNLCPGYPWYPEIVVRKSEEISCFDIVLNHYSYYLLGSDAGKRINFYKKK